MKHFVYIIHSSSKDIYYRGYSADPYKRLQQHNNNESQYTSAKGPWKIIFLQSYDNKTDALRREKVLKKYSHSQIENLLKSSINEYVRE